MSSVLGSHNPLERPPPLLRPRQGGCPIWAGDGTRPRAFWLLGSRIQWWGIHWVESRAVPCLRSVGRCAPCESGWLPRQVGYIAAMRADTGGRWILRISEYAYRQCPALGLAGAVYRGTPLVVRRRADRPNAPWVVEIPPVITVPQLPAAVDVVGVLSLVWGVDLVRLAEDPPPSGDAAERLRPYARPKGGAR